MKSWNIFRLNLLLTSLLVASSALWLEPGKATTFIVYTNTDDGSAGTLRHSIDQNNSLGGGNTIVFSNSVTGTITLLNGELLIAGDVTIIGPGANVLTIDGNNASRVFNVSNFANVSISGLAIVNGRAAGTPPANRGGGIYNQSSSLTVSNCTLSGNLAVNGGAIYNDGLSGAFLEITASTLSGNSATNGAGIDNDSGTSGFAQVTISASTLSGNSAASGGGIFSIGHQDAVADVFINACTLSDNSAAAGGGIFNMRSVLGAATVEIGDTILKAGASGANIANSFGTVTSLGYNLSGDAGGGFLTNATDQINTDPILGPLQDNGGPTMTMALRAGSPAIDKGKSSDLATDQRGAPRPFDFSSAPNAGGGDGSDIGAFELGSPRLGIQRAAGRNVVLSWPFYYGDFTLQSVTNLSASNLWSTVAGTPALVGDEFKVTNDTATASRYFRLHVP
jgi:hypothetical protein